MSILTTKTVGRMFANIEGDFVLEETPMSRLVFRAQIHPGGIRGKIIRMRRVNGDIWKEGTHVNIKELNPNQGIDMQLRTEAVYKLNEALVRLKSLLEQQGIQYGENEFVTARADEVIVTGSNKAHYINELLQKGYSEDIWKKLVETDPDLATKLSLSRIYYERKKLIDDFESDLDKDLGEIYWQELLAKNRWIFGNSYIGRIGERRINIKSTLDHPLITEDGFLEIVEIKDPQFPFWRYKTNGAYFLYRDKYLVPHSELENGITQGANYILEVEKEMDSKIWSDNHGGIYPLKPKCLVVHGRSKDWKEKEAEAHRLLNDRLHGIIVITFDYLLLRAKQTLEVFNPDNYDNS